MYLMLDFACTYVFKLYADLQFEVSKLNEEVLRLQLMVSYFFTL